MLTRVAERDSDGSQYGSCRPCRCLLCPCLPLTFSTHLTRVPALEEVGEGGGTEGRKLHLKTLELAAWGCGVWRGVTLLKLAALFSLLTTLPSFQLPSPRNGSQGVGCAGVLCTLATHKWYI